MQYVATKDKKFHEGKWEDLPKEIVFAWDEFTFPGEHEYYVMEDGKVYGTSTPMRHARALGLTLEEWEKLPSVKIGVTVPRETLLELGKEAMRRHLQLREGCEGCG